MKIAECTLIWKKISWREIRLTLATPSGKRTLTFFGANKDDCLRQLKEWIDERAQKPITPKLQ